jgi:hypothetical protein
MRIKSTWCVCSVIVLFSALIFVGHIDRPALAQIRSPGSEIRPFLGTWTAVHARTPISVLPVHSDKGALLGGVQVCSYTVNTQSSGTVDVITDPTLSKTASIRNVKIAGRSMSFDWKDPDGDEDHWRLGLTGKNTGRIIWVGLSSGLKVQPISVSKNAHTPA